LGVNALSFSSQSDANAAITTVSDAIDNMAGFIQDVGEYNVRLSSKETTLSVAYTNTDAVRSNVEDADLVKEQMEMMKLQILQQTAATAFTQANMAPQMVLQLFQ
ncbi:MAG: flagellin, partial [Candidatus Marinimicrobia bacterium]|nr:flagellin [Candidatus Neomarinimicrobiota bacterium]